MGGTGGGLRGAPVPGGGSASPSSRPESPPKAPAAGGGGGLFLPPSWRPGRQEVSARPARCGEAGSWEQPQLDWRPAVGWGRRSARRADPRPRVPALFPAAPASPPRSPPRPPSPAHRVGGLAAPQLCTSPLGAHGLSGLRRGAGPCSWPWGPLGPSGVRRPSPPRLPPPLFTRRLPPRKLNPPAVILFGNFGQLP